MHGPGSIDRDPPPNTPSGSTPSRSTARDRIATESVAHAAMGQVGTPVSVAADPAPAPRDTRADDARGRRTLSTAFVRIGPDGLLRVDLANGRALVLRDVVMRPRDYCGTIVQGGKRDARHCGGYADVAAAVPGGGSIP